MISKILIVMLAATWVSVFAERRNIQPPLLLALVGLGASFLPVARFELEPEIILSLVLPPLLFSAATEFSFVSFIRRLGSIVNLGVLLVVVTTAVVGGVAAAVIPGMTLPVALVLAAVVSPPDAVTAVAIGRKLGLPSKLMTVLKGESLINDAAALTLFSFALASVTGTHLAISNIFLFLGYSAVVGVIVGILLGAAVTRARVRMTNPSLITMLTILLPFAAYLLAEELGASGVLAVVTAGFSIGHNASEASYEARIQERQFWRTADTLLEAFVFAYIGLQMRFAFENARASGYEILDVLLMSLVVLLAVILVRFAWVFVTAGISRWRYAGDQRRRASPRLRRRVARGPANPRRGGFELMPPFSWRENLVISWTGMRGVVTLAAAAGIPLTTVAGAAFPERDVIQVVAFTVTIGTLLLQGLTLPWLIRALGISDPGEAAYKIGQQKIARSIGKAASHDAISAFRDRQTDPNAIAAAEMMLARLSSMDAEQKQQRQRYGATMLEIGREVLLAQRKALVAARDSRQLDDEVLRERLEDMDLQEAVMANWDADGDED